ncbi:MAG TPA: phage integrase SAM-like domain-containing protein [Puia sp.]
MKPSFFLKANPKQKSALVIMQMRWGKNKLTYSTSVRLEEDEKKYWKDGRIKDCPETEVGTELKTYNTLLNKLETAARNKFIKESVNGIPNPVVIKKYLDEINGKEKRAKILETAESFFTFFEKVANGEVLSLTGEKREKNTLDCYKRVLSHLKQYDKKLDWQDISVTWWHNYRTWLAEELKLKVNSIKSDLLYLKALMNQGTELGYNTNLDFKKKAFSARGEKTKSIYLTPAQIEKLYRHDFDKERRIVVDYFVIACETGLRFSDWKKIRTIPLIKKGCNSFLDLTPQKTKKHQTEVRILCSDLFLEILEKYRGKLPAAPVYSTARVGVHKACVSAGVGNNIHLHDSRRSYATNAYLGGMDTTLIRTITGHKTEAAFKSYLQLDAELSGDLQAEHAEKKKGKKEMRVVA